MCLCVRLIGRALVTLALLKSVEETDNFPPKYRRFSKISSSSPEFCEFSVCFCKVLKVRKILCFFRFCAMLRPF